MHGHGVAAIVADHPFGFAGGAGGIEHVERVGGEHGGAVHRAGGGDGYLPVQVATRLQVGVGLGALVDHAALGFMSGLLDGRVYQRFVFNDLVHFYAAGRRHNDPGFGIVDTHRQLVSGKAPEHHGVDGAQARGGEHGHGGFRDHRHVDQYPVAFFHPLLAQGTREGGDAFGELGVGDGLFAVRDGGIVVDRHLIAAPGSEVGIQRHVAGVHDAIGKPAVDTVFILAENGGGEGEPVQLAGLVGPEGVRIVDGRGVFLFVTHLWPLFAPARVPAGWCIAHGDAVRDGLS